MNKHGLLYNLMDNFTNMGNFTITWVTLQLTWVTLQFYCIKLELYWEERLGAEGPAEVAFVALAIPLKYSQFKGI